MDKELVGFGWYIKRINNAFAREAFHNAQSRNLTLQQNHLLFVLSDAENHTRTLKELEEIFGCAQSTLAGLVTRMEKKGLVEGYTDPRDRRIKHVRLTESGAAMRQSCHEDMLRAEARLIAGLTEEEKAVFMICLRKVYSNLNDEDREERPHRKFPPPCRAHHGDE